MSQLFFLLLPQVFHSVQFLVIVFQHLLTLLENALIGRLVHDDFPKMGRVSIAMLNEQLMWFVVRVMLFMVAFLDVKHLGRAFLKDGLENARGGRCRKYPWNLHWLIIMNLLPELLQASTH
jgi:hypothetical protein